MLVEEVVDNRNLVAEITPELRTLGFIVYTRLPICESAPCPERF